MNFSTSQVYMFSGTDGTWQELDAKKLSISKEFLML